MKIAVTGSTGQLGSFVVDHLVALGVTPADVIALARSEEKAAAHAAKGVTVRIADYNVPETLGTALEGVDKLLLISSSEVGKRYEQHKAVIAAAKAAGVKHLVYTSITRAETSENPLAPEHKATEAEIKGSGLTYTILRNNWYLENYIGDAQYAISSGTLAAAVADGKVASATRSEYAEAAAKVLTGSGYENSTLELAGPAWSFSDLAAACSTIAGKPVKYTPLTAEARKGALIAAGLDEGTAGFLTLLDESVAAGTLDIDSKDLEAVLGRKPQSLTEAIPALL